MPGEKMRQLKIPIFRLGSWKHPVYGIIKGTQETFDKLVDNFRKNTLGRPPFVRLGHTKDNATTFGDTPAEAWVSELIQDGNVLYALAWPTSTEIVDAVRNKRYRFASPEYNPEYMDKETGNKMGPVLEAIGLTNEPFLTKLPDTVVLAAPPETIYLDHEEVNNHMPDKELLQENNNLLRKMADAFSKFMETFKPGTGGQGGLSDEERNKLSEIDGLKVQLANTVTELNATKAELSKSQQNTWATQVDARLSALVAAGVPPAMCEQARTVLLANPAMATTMVKLADNKEISMAEQIYATLDALPKEHRIMLSQFGAQSSTQPGQATAKQCYGDVVPELNSQ